MISSIVRGAIPFIRTFAARRAPLVSFPAHAVARSHFSTQAFKPIDPETKSTLMGSIFMIGGIAVTYGIAKRENDYQSKESVKRGRIWDLRELSSKYSDVLEKGEKSDELLKKYIKQGLEFEREYQEFPPAFQAELEHFFAQACERGRISTFVYLANHSSDLKLNLPSVKLSHIDKGNLIPIVSKLLSDNIKKIAIEDFEWALLHKNFELYELFLSHLGNDRKATQMPVKDLPSFRWYHGKDNVLQGDPLYTSYEYLAEHPKLKHLGQTAREFHERHNAMLLKTANEKMELLHAALKEALKADLPLEELWKANLDRGPDRVLCEGKERLTAEVRDQLCLLNQLILTNDTSSLHWIWRKGCWMPPYYYDDYDY